MKTKFYTTLLGLSVAGIFSVLKGYSQTNVTTTYGLISGNVPVASGTSSIQYGMITDDGSGVGIGMYNAGYKLNVNGNIYTNGYSIFPTGINNSSGGITNTGAISGASTISASGLITGYGYNNSNGGITNAGAISGASTISASGVITGYGLNNNNAGITNAGAISGVTSFALSGSLSGTSLTASSGNINLNTANYAYMIAGADVLWHNNNTANIFVGINAGLDITSGSYNSFVGYNAGANTTTGAYNSFMGYGAGLTNTTSNHNSAFGYLALNSTITNGFCSAFGSSALKANTTGASNTGIGESALVANTTGSYNTACGLWAGYGNTTGTGNTFVGLTAGGANTTGSYNTFVGYGANIASPFTYTNCAAIGNGAIVNASNKVRVGNTTTTAIEGQVAFVGVSDVRFKTNIKEEVKGLEFIKKLRPVMYNFDTKKFDEFLIKNMPDSIKAMHTKGVDYEPSSNIVHTGFIAQEVEKAAKDCSYNFDGVYAPVDDNDNYSLAYSQFVVPLVKAVQELSATTDSLVTVITKQDSIINAKNAKVDDLQNQISNCCSNIIIGKGLINKEIVEPSSTTAILYQNNPNPFNQQTNIQYSIPTNSSIASIMVFDLTGKLIKTIPVTTFGDGTLTINGNELNPGMFVYSLIVDGKIVDTKSMILTH